MNLFISASSKDRAFARLLILEAMGRGHQVYDWTSNPGWDSELHPSQVATDLEEALDEAEALIWYPTDHASTGAGLEVGYMLGRGRPIIALTPTRPLSSNVYAWHSKVSWCVTLSEALSTLERFVKASSVAEEVVR